MNSLRLLYRIPDKKLSVVYNGVDYDFWDPKKISPQTIQAIKKKYGRIGGKIFFYYGHSGKSK
jgi:glycogen synthase